MISKNLFNLILAHNLELENLDLSTKFTKKLKEQYENLFYFQKYYLFNIIKKKNKKRNIDKNNFFRYVPITQTDVIRVLLKININKNLNGLLVFLYHNKRYDIIKIIYDYMSINFEKIPEIGFNFSCYIDNTGLALYYYYKYEKKIKKFLNKDSDSIIFVAKNGNIKLLLFFLKILDDKFSKKFYDLNIFKIILEKNNINLFKKFIDEFYYFFIEYAGNQEIYEHLINHNNIDFVKVFINKLWGKNVFYYDRLTKIDEKILYNLYEMALISDDTELLNKFKETFDENKFYKVFILPFVSYNQDKKHIIEKIISYNSEIFYERLDNILLNVSRLNFNLLNYLVFELKVLNNIDKNHLEKVYDYLISYLFRHKDEYDDKIIKILSFFIEDIKDDSIRLDINKIFKERGLYCLTYAAYMNKLNIIKYFMEGIKDENKRAKLNYLDENNYLLTLAYAIENCNKEMINYLLIEKNEKKTEVYDIKDINKKIKTHTYHGIRENPVIFYLILYKDKFNDEIIETLKYLVENFNADLTVVNNEGKNILMLAIEKNFEKLLIESRTPRIKYSKK